MEESQSIRNLVVDPSEDKMYFMSGRNVSRANFDGSGKEMIRESSVNVNVFVLDSVERRMYWTSDYGFIFKGNMNFSEGKYIGLRGRPPYNLRVDPYSRLVTHFFQTPTFPKKSMGQI